MSASAALACERVLVMTGRDRPGARPGWPYRFGGTASGDEIVAVDLVAGPLAARVMTWGASLADLRLDGHGPPLVLGYPAFEAYPGNGSYFGATPGRFANRIAGGRFRLDGRTVDVDRNQAGRHALHGGARGFGKRVWVLEDCSATQALFTLASPDGDMGFPGALHARCTYGLEANGALRVTLEAVANAPTVCSLTHHSYFNLEDGGATSAAAHRLRVAADEMLPVDDEGIPTGPPLPVAGTGFDFRAPRPIHAGAGAADLDHNFCLSRARTALRPVAWVTAPASGITLEVETTEPGLQVYGGHKLAPAVPGLDGLRYGARAGFCLEPQVWPDAPNHAGDPGWPSARLDPGETYRAETVYRFARGGAG